MSNPLTSRSYVDVNFWQFPQKELINADQNFVGLLYLYFLYLGTCILWLNVLYLRTHYGDMLMTAVLFELYLLKGAGEIDRGRVIFRRWLSHMLYLRFYLELYFGAEQNKWSTDNFVDDSWN
jgi:hypothetical protein